MMEKGFYLILGLPNNTSCTQEQDQLYQAFKGRTRMKTDEVFCKKLAQRSEAINNAKAQLRDIGFVGEWNHIEGDRDDKVINIDSDDDLDDNPDKDSDIRVTNRAYKAHLGTQAVRAFLKRLKEAMQPPSLLNDDICIILNRRYDDPPPLPFSLQLLLNIKLLIAFAVLVMIHLLGNTSTASISAMNW